MEKLKCPKCHHEIKDDEKYCNTCGFCLKNLTKERAIELLKLDLAGYKMRLDFVVNTGDIKLFSEKVKALEMAIEALEKTAHEVSINKKENLISLNISIDKEKLTREIIKLINDSQANKSIGLINI